MALHCSPDHHFPVINIIEFFLTIESLHKNVKGHNRKFNHKIYLPLEREHKPGFSSPKDAFTIPLERNMVLYFN